MSETKPPPAAPSPPPTEQPTTEKAYDLIEELAQYLGLSGGKAGTPNDSSGSGQLMGGILDPKNRIDRRVITSLVDGSSGAMMAKDLVTAIKTGSDKLKTHITVIPNDGASHIAATHNTATGVPAANFGNMVKQVTTPPQQGVVPNNAKIASIVIPSTTISPATFNARINEIFFNSMPNTVLSQATPYLRVELVTNRKGDLFKTKPHIPKGSLYFYLEGARAIKPGADSIATAQPPRFSIKNQAKAGKLKGFGVAGSEIFLAPQTLVSSDSRARLSGASTGRRSKIIDPFAPLASITSMSIDVHSVGGLLYYKQGTLGIRLHDRSRLNELSELVSPRFMGTTYLVITSGYQIQNVPGNVFVRVMNQMRTTEVYRVVNSSYILTAAGGFDITLKISMEGSDLFSILDTGLSTAAGRQLTQEIQALREKIIAWVAEEQGQGKLQQRMNILPKFFSEGFDGATVTTELKSQISACLAVTKTAKAFSTELKNLADKMAEKNSTQQSSRKTATASKLTAAAKTKDPFIYKEQKSGHISLGKLIAVLHGESLKAISGNVDEFQFIYYKFNCRAGKMQNRPISSFPINIADIKKKLAKYFDDHASSNLKLSSFLNLINTEYIKKDSNAAYGLSGITFKGGKESGPRRMKKGNTKTNEFGGIFQRPMLGIYMSSATKRAKDGEPTELSGNVTIMRIHIFDMNATPYIAATALLSSDVLAAQSFNKAFTDKSPVADKALFMRQLAILAKAELVDISAGNDKNNTTAITKLMKGQGTISLNPIASKVSKTMQKLAPVIRYGTAGSVIQAGGLSSMEHTGLLSARLSESPSPGSEQTGVIKGNMPQEILPTQVSFSCMGCPFLLFGQQYYIDFDTGTNADNIYMISKLTHTFAPGSFKTSWTAQSIFMYGTFSTLQATVQAGLRAVEAKTPAAASK